MTQFSVEEGAGSSADRLMLADLMVRVLPMLHRLMVAEVHSAPNARGMSLPQFRVLVRLNSRDHRPTELAAALEIGKSTLTIITDTLVHRGLVERLHEVPDDRRAVVLRITPAGRALYRALETHVARGLTVLLNRLSEREREGLGIGLSGFERLVRDGTGQRPGAASRAS